MGLFFRRSLRLSRNNRLNVSSSGASVSHKVGPVQINSNGRVSIRLPIRGLSLRFKLW